jgi:hypothetical protein
MRVEKGTPAADPARLSPRPPLPPVCRGEGDLLNFRSSPATRAVPYATAGSRRTRRRYIAPYHHHHPPYHLRLPLPRVRTLKSRLVSPGADFSITPLSSRTRSRERFLPRRGEPPKAILPAPGRRFPSSFSYSSLSLTSHPHPSRSAALLGTSLRFSRA